MEDRFNLYSIIKEKNNYTSDDLPNFNEIDIKNLIISDINLDDLISVKSEYRNTEFNHISLYSAYFVQTSFKECTFQNVDFTKSNLNNTVFESCSFISCSFASAEIMGANITNCNFKKCKFTDIIFSDNKISNTQFEITDKFFSSIDNNIEENVVWIFD
ncbi:pentapeptide repeat-containing protein [uncultured Chryseobacterium sp.]|uniref:pentapeptide repeat-containing protein n=1 Tax=uncultured Chryseobacterium sp. TaxID=259322 RepID=UPI0025DB475F|nr:pentapeptide repeat-containing protein [uncultured Chryseobacterium sp.]